MRKLFSLILFCCSIAAAAQTQKVATVTFPASTSSGVTAYNICRSQTTGGPYSQIGQILMPGSLSFDDSTVLRGNTYFYVVQAMVSGDVSANSVEGKGIVPPAPLPPVSITVTVH